MKKGFSLLLAIAFIIVVMTLGAFSLRFATFTSQVNSDTYLKDQSTFLGIFAAEYANTILKATGKKMEKITINYPDNDPILQANVYFDYITDLGSIDPKNTDLIKANPVILTIEISKHPKSGLNEELRYVRRIIQ